ncbi:diguanylate cyclase domain-containing protein [Roseateles sp.]|jgi:diguanylate cyclase (GGDEF)-like protein|uniref:diguanylate cyclase domain-containing protein n=1 Tax=Roseateles sp. TaxID=1971397 RepID=UPI0039199388
MGLRLKVALWVLLLYLLCGGLSLWLLREQLQRSYGELDREAAVDRLELLLLALDDQFLQLDLELRPWSNWDELLQHVRKPDTAFAARNLSPQAIASSGLSWLAVHRADGSLALQAASPAAASWGLPQTLSPATRALIERARLAQASAPLPCGLARSGERLLLLCQRPLLGSTGQVVPGDAAVVTAAIAMGPQISSALARRSTLRFTLEPISPTQALAGDALAVELSTLTGYGPVRLRELDSELQLNWPLRDIGGVPVVALRAYWPRQGLLRAEALLERVGALVLGLAAALALGLMLALDRLVVVRLARLGREVRGIRESRDWRRRVSKQGGDEVAELAKGTNALLAIIADQVQALEALTRSDPLTGLANRRGFDEYLEQALNQSRRDGRPLCLLLADVDFFKRYNDHYGHQQGDQALKIVADCLASSGRRPGDLAARLGGEEFALLLPDTDLDGARHCAAALQRALREAAVVHEAGPETGVLGLSLGLAQLQPEDDAERLYLRADQALYRAKQGGRNRFSE